MKCERGFRRNCGAAVVLLLSLCLGSQPAWAAASENPVSAGDRAVFDRALREDRLTLAPVEGIYFQEDEFPLSLSPDGDKLLLLSGKGLSVSSLASGTRIALTPRAGESHLTEDRIRELFAAPEVVATSWSADGRYLSFCFPAWVYKRGIADCNVWIVDLETGEVDPIFDLPEGVSWRALYEEDAPVIPVRAAFAVDRPALFYDLCVAVTADGDASFQNQYGQLHYETGEIVTLGYTPYEMASGDPRLWQLGDFLVTTVSSKGGIEEGAGLAALSEAETPNTTLAKEGFLAAFLYAARLIAAHGRDAVLYQRGVGYDLAYGSGKSYRQIVSLMECSVGDEGEARFGAFLAMDVNAPARSRLLRLSAEELDDDEMNEALFRRHVRHEVARCFNAAFSPDGGYLLLATQDEGEKGLYVLNRASGECGRVVLPEDFEAGLNAMAFAYEAGPYALAGIQWSGGNRLLLYDGQMNRLYTLAVTGS